MWIILAIIYLFGWGVAIALGEKYMNEPEIGAIIGFLWPVSLPMILGYLIVIKLCGK